MEGSGLNTVNDPFLQVASETRRVGLRQANVLVEMEESDLGPVNVGLEHDRFEKFELRGTCGRDQIGLTACSDSVPNEASRFVRCCLGQLEP